MPVDAAENTFCTTKDSEDAKRCANYLLKDKFMQDLQIKCEGKRKCQLEQLSSYVDTAFSADMSCLH